MSTKKSSTKKARGSASRKRPVESPLVQDLRHSLVHTALQLEPASAFNEAVDDQGKKWAKAFGKVEGVYPSEALDALYRLNAHTVDTDAELEEYITAYLALQPFLEWYLATQEEGSLLWRQLSVRLIVPSFTAEVPYPIELPTGLPEEFEDIWESGFGPGDQDDFLQADFTIQQKVFTYRQGVKMFRDQGVAVKKWPAQVLFDDDIERLAAATLQTGQAVLASPTEAPEEEINQYFIDALSLVMTYGLDTALDLFQVWANPEDIHRNAPIVERLKEQYKINIQLLQFDPTELVTEGIETCSRCGNKRISYIQIQTRSADEPISTFYTCLNCRFKWRR